MNNTLKRVLLSIVIIAVYLLLAPFVVFFLREYFYFLDFGNGITGIALTLVPGFLLVNLVVYYLLFRRPIKYIIVTSFVAACLAAFGVFIVLYFELNPVRDAYGFKTSVVTSATVSLICISIFFILKVNGKFK